MKMKVEVQSFYGPLWKKDFEEYLQELEDGGDIIIAINIISAEGRSYIGDSRVYEIIYKTLKEDEDE